MEIESSRNTVNLQERFDFRGEQQPIRLLPYIKRFFPKSVARKDESLLGNVPQSEGEHTPQLLNKLDSPFLIKMHDDFRVRITAENVPFFFKVSTQLFEVINLSVAHAPNAIGLIGNGLMSTVHVNDA